MSRPDSLLVTGGQVLAGGKWTAADVFLANGRIVSVGSDVRTSGTGGGPGEPTEVGTAGAGAERAALRPFASNETATAAGSESPAAGGVSARRLDASGLLVVPGFLDLQCNGAVGVDITAEPERLWDVAAALPQWGGAGDPAGPAGARPVAVPLGLHLEGPFLAPERRGAHPAEHLRAPDAAMVADERWTRDAVAALGTLEGRVRLGVLEAFATADGVRLADGTLAGTSDLSLDRAVRNLVGFAGVPLAAAVAAVTASPPALVGLGGPGVVAPGAVGDLVLLDAGGEVVATVIGGRVAYDRPEGPWRS